MLKGQLYRRRDIVRVSPAMNSSLVDDFVWFLEIFFLTIRPHQTIAAIQYP